MSTETTENNPKRKKHNKSMSTSLSLLDFDDKEILEFVDDIKSKTRDHQGLTLKSKCQLVPALDGRFSHGSKKVAYAYQLIAFGKYGREQLKRVTSSKEADDLTISHLCGTLYCCNPTHIILEPKKINDQRTHCHWCIKNAQKKNGEKGLKLFFDSGSCPHTPPCCSEDIN